MSTTYQSYDRKKYPHIAASEKSSMESKNLRFTQEDCDRVREGGVTGVVAATAYFNGDRERALQSADDAIRISDENGKSSREWAKQQKAQQKNDSLHWGLYLVYAIFLIGVFYLGAHPKLAAYTWN